MNKVLCLLFCFAAFSSAGATASLAASNGEKIKGFTVGQVIPGYNCLDVVYPPEAERNAALLPPVFSAPSENSRKLGTQGGLVFVVWPLHNVSGYLEILRFNGERGWIAAKDTKPYTYPESTNEPGGCTIKMTASGAIASHGYSLNSAK